MDGGNKVYLDKDNVIVIEVVGDQDETSVRAMGEQAAAIIKELRSQGKRCLIFDNLLIMGKVDGSARERVVALSKELDYDKTAMVGKGGIMRIGTNLMLRATGKGDTVRFFDDPDHAMRWLKS